MADCFSLQSIKEYVEDLRAIEAYGEMFVSPYEAGNYADTIEQLMQKVAEDDAVIERIRKKAEDEIEALLAENAKLKELYDKLDFERVKMKTERNAAVADMRHDCYTCAYREGNRKEFPCVDCLGVDCPEYDKWEWRGVTDANVCRKKEEEDATN